MKKAVIILAEGFEEIEALSTIDVLRRAYIKCDICSLKVTKDNCVTGSHGITVKADENLSQVKCEYYDCIVLPGGMKGTSNLKESPNVLALLNEFNENKKLIAAICAAPSVLAKAGIIKDKKITSYPGFEEELKDGIYCKEIVIQDGNIITARGAAASLYFAYKIAENLTSLEVVSKLREGMMLNFVESKIQG